jgi:hypothetical protein
MKLHIVHDAAGKILGAVNITGDKYKGPLPMPGRGHRLLVLEVPPEHSGKSFLEICEGMRVNAKSKTLVATSKKIGKKRK